MPLSSALMDTLLKKCTNAQERLLVLLIRDLDGRPLELGRLGLSDFDRVSGTLRIHPADDGRPERVKVGQETLRAFHEYIRERRDNEPAFLVDQSGRPLTSPEVSGILDQLAERAGLRFDAVHFRFEKARPERGPRLVTKGASRDLFYLYGIVSHPLRRQIVELLGDEGPLGFAQIKIRLKARVGTLYYHFDMLAGLVAQDPGRQYMLTEAGREAYRKLRSPEYVQSTGLLADSVPTTQRGLERSLRFLLPASLLSSIQSLSIAAVAVAVLVLGLGAFSAYEVGLETVVFFLNPTNQSPVLLGVAFLANWLAIYAVADGIATFVFRRKGEHIVLLLGTAYSLIPMLVFMGWWYFASTFTIQAPGLTTIVISRIVLIVVQAWSLVLLARIVSVLKGLRLDKAAVISLALAYLSIMIAYVRGF